MSIENKLARLFDYQKFEGNKELEALINSSRNSVRDLSDDELDMVSAAGVSSQGKFEDVFDKANLQPR